MQRVLVAILVAAAASLVVAVASAPAKESSEEDDIVYDQRQNGSENLRISVSDVMVVVAPAEGMVPVAGDALNSLALGFLGAAMLNKDKNPAQPGCGEHGRCKTATQRSRLRLSNLIQPLMNRVHHQR